MAGAVPAGGGVPSAPARLVVAPALTTLTVSPVAPATTADQLKWELPRDSPAIISLRFVSFELPPVPAKAEVDAIQMVGVSLAATLYGNLSAAELAALTASLTHAI